MTLPSTPHQLLYSTNMRGVDVYDALRTSYTVQIGTKLWWTRLYLFGLDTTLTNAYILYRESTTGRVMTQKAFRIAIAYALLGRRPSGCQPEASAHRRVPHVPSRAPSHRVCSLCGKRTHYCCPRCNDTRLCLRECFQLFHPPK